jgi:hypothetical protein
VASSRGAQEKGSKGTAKYILALSPRAGSLQRKVGAVGGAKNVVALMQQECKRSPSEGTGVEKWLAASEYQMTRDAFSRKETSSRSREKILSCVFRQSDDMVASPCAGSVF